MKIGNKVGCFAVASAIGSALSPYLYNSAKATFVFFAFALLFSAAAGVLRPKAWFFLTGSLVLLLIFFAVFVGILWQIGKSGI